MNLSFKKCDLKDLNTLIEIARGTFIAAFEADNNPKYFKEYINSAFSKEKVKNELTNLNSSFYFAYLNDDLIGYLKLNEKEAQNEQFESDTIELERIYVLDKFQGQQLGKHMLLESIRIAKTKKASFLWLGVWEHNKGAIRFYKRYNFKKFDTHIFYMGKDKQIDWLLKLDFN